jgi:hypothetical protein
MTFPVCISRPPSQDFTRAVRQLQQTYVEESVLLDLAACASRSARERFQEDAARLFGPLL